MFNVWVKGTAVRKLPRPMHSRAAAPLFTRRRQFLGVGAAKAFGGKIIKRAVQIVKGRASFRAVKEPGDARIASNRQFPGTRNMDGCARAQSERRHGIILNLPSASPLNVELPALRIEIARCARHFWKAKIPQSEIHQVNA